jgi:ATPase subunit of ABC transporter with duplicated ATPase domains
MSSFDPLFQARLEAFQRYKIKHPHLEAMDHLITEALQEHTSYQILAIYGPSGVGKSTVIQRIADRMRAEERNPSFTPVVIIQASPEDVGAQARLDFYLQVLDALRGNVAVRDRADKLSLVRQRGKKSTGIDPQMRLAARCKKDGSLFKPSCSAFISSLSSLLHDFLLKCSSHTSLTL